MAVDVVVAVGRPEEREPDTPGVERRTEVVRDVEQPPEADVRPPRGAPERGREVPAPCLLGPRIPRRPGYGQSGREVTRVPAGGESRIQPFDLVEPEHVILI